MGSLRLPPFPVLKEILKMYKLGALKRLSQNFLLDMNVTNKIARKAGDLKGRYVLEVGPGPGGITRSILKQYPKKLIVVEKDKRFKPALDMLAEAFETVNGEMDIIYEDIMALNMENFFPEDIKKEWHDDSPPINIIGNLPFSVSTALIIKWLHAISQKSSAWVHGRACMTLTFQKEVAERLVAPEDSKQRCRLSVMAQAWTQPTINFLIPGEAFVPKPKVDVGVVSFVPLVQPRTKHEFKFFEKVTRHLFSFRQKYVIRCVETLFPANCREELSLIMFKLSDLEPSRKAISLSVEEVDRLATAYKYLLEKHPEISLYDYRASRRLLPLASTKNVQIQDCME